MLSAVLVTAGELAAGLVVTGAVLVAVASERIHSTAAMAATAMAGPVVAGLANEVWAETAALSAGVASTAWIGEASQVTRHGG